MEQRLLPMSNMEEGTPPRPAKAPVRGSPEGQRRSLLTVASIEEESPLRPKEPNFGQTQLQSLEATFEQLLNQTASGLRKDMSMREERINRRLETEQKEQQSSIFDLRRDLALQQSADLAAFEERLAQRLDEERREQKAALAELRHEVTEQQELRGQVAALRRELGAAQTTLAKLAGDWAPGEPRLSEMRQSTRPLEQATAAAEAAIEDLRRELNGQREQVRMLSATSESSLEGLRRELAVLRGGEAGSPSEQMRRTSAELSRSIQEVSSSVEALGASLRAELRREVERLGSELEQERAEAEQRSGLQEAHRTFVGKRLDTMESRFEELRRGGKAEPSQAARAALEARVGALEVSCRDIAAISTQAAASPTAKAAESEELDTMRVALDRTQAVANGAQREIARLAKELEEQQRVAARLEESAGGQADGLACSQEQMQQLSAEILKEVSRLDQRLSEELLSQIRSVEGTAHGGLSSCRAALEEASRSIGHLTQELSRERSERCAALADLSLRVDDAAQAAERAERRTSEEVASRSNGPSLDVGDSASVVTGAVQKATSGAVIGSAEHVALAACVGELDAELRMEIGERIHKVVGELRDEIAERVGAVEERFSGGTTGCSQVEARLGQLEAARLDLRLGALETAWQRAASLVLTGRQAELGELRPPGAAEATGGACSSPEDGSTCSVEAMRKITQLREMLHEQAQRLSAPELGELEAAQQQQQQQQQRQRPEPLLGSPLSALRAEFGDSASQFAGSAGGYTPRAAVLNGQAGEVGQEVAAQLQELQDRPPAQGDPDDPLWQPLISDELKERLEVLVKQVKRTLDRSQGTQDADGTTSVSAPDFDRLCQGSQASLPRSGSITVPCMSNMSVCGDPDAALCVRTAQPPELQCGYPAPLVEGAVGRMTVGAPVLRQVSITAPRRAASPHRSQSPYRHVSTTTTTTTRVRSPSPMRRTSGPPPRVVNISPVQPIALRPDVPTSSPRPLSGSWAGPAMR